MTYSRLHRLGRSRLGDVRDGLRVRGISAPSTAWRPAIVYAIVAAICVVGSPELFPLGLPSVAKVVVLPPLLVIYPSLIEEVFFRGVLLPRSLLTASRARRFAAVTASTVVFTAYHPANHVLVGLSDTSLFVEPTFLVIVAALGYACGYSYLRSGSLWMPIGIHWATTVVWNLFLGR